MLKVKNLSFKVGSFTLSNISLEIQKSEYLVLLGPTGSGKSTLLKCICGINRIKKGEIFLNNKNITNISIENRNIGYVPQDYKLFPNLKTEENILFGLKARGLSKNEIKNRLNFILSLLKIQNLLNRDIHNLSGGEKQKVALARALIIQPDLLLLDEPFSSIDQQFKGEMLFELKNIVKKLDIPVLHITHNFDEAYAISDKIAIIINGKIEQIGKKEDVFLKPKNENVASFLGIKNIYEGIINDISDDRLEISSNGIKIIALKEEGFRKGQKIKFCIRPQDIKIIKEGIPIREELRENIFEGVIISEYFYNDYSIINLLVNGIELELKFPYYIYLRYDLMKGKRIKVGVWQKGIILFHSESSCSTATT